MQNVLKRFSNDRKSISRNVIAIESTQLHVYFLKALCIGLEVPILNQNQVSYEVNCLNFDDFHIEMTRRKLLNRQHSRVSKHNHV